MFKMDKMQLEKPLVIIPYNLLTKIFAWTKYVKS